MANNTFTTPKDGKTFSIKGHRFETMDEVHEYARNHNGYASNCQQIGNMTMCDLTEYEEKTLLSDAEISDLYRPA